MKNFNIIEVAEKSKAGRRYIKGVLHEIYPTEQQWNKNGITWLEEYTKENLESAIGIPLCCQFIDDDEKDVPLGHGDVNVKDGKIIFEDSLVVGSVTKVYIDTVDIIDNNEKHKTIKGLIYEGFIYEQRYPMFTRWLIENKFDKKPIASSVEIMAKDSYDEIIYRNGWKENGRIPTKYAYSGHAILSVEPADDSSVVLEINNALKSKNEKNKEVCCMAEQNKDTILELNNKIEEKITEVNKLKSELNSKEEDIKKLTEDIKTKQDELKKLKGESDKKDEKIKENEKKSDEKDKKIKEMESELNTLRSFKKEADNKALINELNKKLSVYTEEEKDTVKEKVETFNKEPKKEDIEKIINEVNTFISNKIIEDRKVKAEQNAKENENKVEDIYSSVIEVNSEDTITVDDLY